MKKNYKAILNFYQNLLTQKGSNLKGLGWDSKKKTFIRNDLIYKIIKFFYKKKISILDFGCGISDLYTFLKQKKIDLSYDGLDTSKKAIEYSKKKYRNNNYYHEDILKKTSLKKKYDLIVLNGVFTIKDKLNEKEMYSYVFRILFFLKKYCKGIIVVNFLTNCPDWKNNKNFYPSLDKLSRFVNLKISKKYYILYLSELFENFFILNLKK